MVLDVDIVLTWILFMALFPMAFFWLRRVWRILIKRDFSEVALKRGVSPPDPERYAPYEMAINLVAGSIIVGVIFSVLAAQLDYNTWTAVAGSTIWLKFFANFLLGRHAHPITSKKQA